jgi:hypothetical protein
MMIVALTPRRRRLLALCLASILLHWLAVSSIATGLSRSAPRAADATAALVQARLALTAPTTPIAAPPTPTPARTAPRARRAPPHRSPPIEAPAAPLDADALAMAPAIEPPVSPPAATEDAASGAAAPAAAADGAPPAPAAPPAAPVPPEPRRYKVSMPPSADITLDITRTDANGTSWSGEALLAWKLTGERYRMKVEAGIRLVFARVNLLELTSEGRIDADGFAPVTLTEKRRGRALTATHFDAQERRITFSASQLAFPLPPGAQDKATLPLQLAAIGRADASQLSGDIEIMVGEDRDASLFRFVVLGQEQIETRLGTLLAWHLSRPPRAGAYNSHLEIWLAPSRDWYPVQIRNTEASGAVTTQTVRDIVITDSGTSDAH